MAVSLPVRFPSSAVTAVTLPARFPSSAVTLAARSPSATEAAAPPAACFAPGAEVAARLPLPVAMAASPTAHLSPVATAASLLARLPSPAASPASQSLSPAAMAAFPAVCFPPLAATLLVAAVAAPAAWPRDHAPAKPARRPWQGPAHRGHPRPAARTARLATPPSSSRSRSRCAPRIPRRKTRPMARVFPLLEPRRKHRRADGDPADHRVLSVRVARSEEPPAGLCGCDHVGRTGRIPRPLR